jgi:class 3 adenylate cyclase
MTEKNEQETSISLLSFKLVYKIMLIAGFLVVCMTALINYLFIQKLAEPRIDQVKELANTTSVIVSDIALTAFYDNDQDRINKTLKDSMAGVTTSDGGGFLQISVILYPGGQYYASTNSDFVNKKVGQSLLKKIEENGEPNTIAEKLNYEFNDRTVPVLHFLRNITVVQKGEEQRIAVTQILFDYGKILAKTRQSLMVATGIFLICLLIFIWLAYLPVTNIHRKLVYGFGQISNKNFDFKLRTRDQGELGLLFDAFNRMTNRLDNYYQKKRQSKMDSVINSMKGTADGSRDSVLRKADITCLCAKIPDVQEGIEEKALEEIADFVFNFIDPLETIVKEFGGQVIKVLGDKVYVLFEGINSIDNSVRTALKANQKWLAINHERKVLNRKKFDFGIGIHSAEGVAGTIGHHSVNYTILGKATSVAEYLCSSAHPETILVSSSLMDKASGSFPHQVISELQPVNLGENEQVLLVSNLQFGDDSPPSLAQLQSDSQGVGADSGRPPENYDQFPDSMAGMTGTTNVESSIPDMLEETLSNAPLDSVATSGTKKKVPLPDPNRHAEEEQELKSGKKTSLWDEFGS